MRRCLSSIAIPQEYEFRSEHSMAHLSRGAYQDGIAWRPRRTAVIRPYIPLLAAACMNFFAGVAVGQAASVYEATLAEPDAKTEQVSTDQLKRILANRSAILVDTRTRARSRQPHELLRS